MQDGPVSRLCRQVLSFLGVADVQHVQVNTGDTTHIIQRLTFVRSSAIICCELAVHPGFCFEENPGVSSPVLGLGVLVFLLVVAITLDFSGQSRMSHLRVVAH